MFYQPESLRINPLSGVPYGYIRKEYLQLDLSVEGEDWTLKRALENLTHERAQHFGISVNDARLHLLEGREVECLYIPEKDLGNDRYRREITDTKVTFLFKDTEKVRVYGGITYLELPDEGFLILYSHIYGYGKEGLFGQCVMSSEITLHQGYRGYGVYDDWWK